MTRDIEQLFRQYAPDVLRFALYLTGDRGSAEDITSETFVRAWISPAPIRLSTVKGHLFTIARNLYLHELRRGRQSELTDVLRDETPGPQRCVEGREELDLVLAELRHLPEPDRTALLMRVNDQVPYEDIALTLGISTTAAKVKVHRARLLLQKRRDGMYASHA